MVTRSPAVEGFGEAWIEGRRAAMEALLAPEDPAKRIAPGALAALATASNRTSERRMPPPLRFPCRRLLWGKNPWSRPELRCCLAHRQRVGDALQHLRVGTQLRIDTGAGALRPLPVVEAQVECCQRDRAGARQLAGAALEQQRITDPQSALGGERDLVAAAELELCGPQLIHAQPAQVGDQERQPAALLAVAVGCGDLRVEPGRVLGEDLQAGGGECELVSQAPGVLARAQPGDEGRAVAVVGAAGEAADPHAAACAGAAAGPRRAAGMRSRLARAWFARGDEWARLDRLLARADRAVLQQAVVAAEGGHRRSSA